MQVCLVGSIFERNWVFSPETVRTSYIFEMEKMPEKKCGWENLFGPWAEMEQQKMENFSSVNHLVKGHLH